jgi:hypothetical protein
MLPMVGGVSFKSGRARQWNLRTRLGRVRQCQPSSMIFSMQEMGGEHVVFAGGHGEGRGPVITERFDD